MALAREFNEGPVETKTGLYIVDPAQCTFLNVRKGPSSNNYAALYTLNANAKVNIYAICGNWYRISETEEKWVCGTYLKIVSTPVSTGRFEAVQLTGDTSSSSSGSSTSTASSYDGVESTQNVNSNTYANYFKRFKNTFGAPFAFMDSADPQYFTNDTEGFGKGMGRAMLSSLYENPSVFSICPGKVNYLPGLGRNEQIEFFSTIREMMGGNLMDDSESGSAGSISGRGVFSGKLYEFKPNYDDYINRLNALARASAILLGIGEELMPGSSIKLGEFDYAYYTTENRSNTKQTAEGFFSSAAATLSSFITDDQYIHFFIANEGSSISEDFTTSTSESFLKQTINGAKLGEYASNLDYLFGGVMADSGIMQGVESDIDELINSAADSGSYVSSLASMFKAYLKGGRMVIPDMIDSVSYKSAVSCRVKFFSLYGDKVSVFLQTILPTLALLNFVIPKQVADNMYTYPYIVRCFQKGRYNTDLAVIEGLRITRGGSEDLSWTVDGLSTEIEVSFDIVPLYSSMMSASSRNPYLFMSNTPLLEYLGNMCGVDLKLDQTQTKLALAKSLIGNYFTDIPVSLGRRVTQGIADSLRGWFNFD